MLTITRISLALLLAVLALTSVHAPAAAGGRPDLKVMSVSISKSRVIAGGTVTVNDVTRNVGKRRAAPSKTRYFLSRDRSKGRTDRVLATRDVPRLRPGARSRGSKTVRISVNVTPRRYYVIACADAKKQVRESREGNNCKATTGQLRVTAPAPPDEITFPMDPNPLAVESTVQSSRAVTQIVSAVPVDQQITATAADGTTYTLTIPGQALLSSEQITLTPVQSVDGLPLSGGLVAGVQIEPHGLMLLQPATLEITSPDAGPLGQQTPFLFAGGGGDLHPYPVAMPETGDTANTIRMTLHHFSTPGVGLGTSTDRANLAARTPAQHLAQLESAVSETLRAERQSQLNGNPPDPAAMQRVVDLMNAYYDDVLRSQLQQAESDPQQAPQATAEAIGWIRQLALLGIEDSSRISEAWERIERIWRNAMNHYWDRCRNEHDLNAIVTLTGIARQARLFGWAFGSEAEDKAMRCGQLEVRFDSLVTSAHSYEGEISSGDTTGRWRVSSTTDIPWTGLGEGPLGYDEFSYNQHITFNEDVPDCPDRYHTEVGTGTTPGLLSALVQLQLNPRVLPPDVEPVLARIRVYPGLSFSTGSAQPTETHHWETQHCTFSSGDTEQSLWLASFRQLHGGNEILEFELLAGGGGEVLLAESWNRSIGNGVNQSLLTEATTLELWHTPLE